MTAPVFERHIGKRRAAPAACPVCGASSTNPWVGHPDIFKALFATYSHPNCVEQRAVAGWRGFTTWWFVCEHESTADRILKHMNAHRDLIDGGRSYVIPVALKVGVDPG